MNRGKREGTPNECPLCGACNLNAAHVINQCSHALVSYSRYEGKNDYDTVVALAAAEDFHELEAINSLIKDIPVGYHIQHGIVPGELSDMIRQDKRLQHPHTGKRKSFFTRGIRLIGSASVKTTSTFITSMYKDKFKPLKSTSYLNSIVRYSRLMKGGLPVLKRFKKKPVLYMSQFRQPPDVVTPETSGLLTQVSPPILTKLIKIRVTNMSQTITVDLNVKYDKELLEIATSHMLDLMIDPESPLPQMNCEIGITLRTLPMQRPRLASHCDPGFSGYILMYALHNEGAHLDMMVEKDRSQLRSFITSISGKAGSEINRQEFVTTADYLRKNPFSLSMPKMCCLWLLPSDIMLFDDAPRCVFWEAESILGDVIKTVIGLNFADLRDLRILPHAVVDNCEYSFLSLPYEMDPEKIFIEIESCFRLILEEVIVGSEKEQYLGIF